MTKFYVFIIFILVSISSQAQSAFDKALTEISSDLGEKLNAKSKKKVVVLYITDITKSTTIAGKYLADIISINIVNDSRNFDVFDRENLNEITEAKKLIAEGYIDVNQAKELGKILSVDAIIIGNYTVLSNTIKLTLKAMDANTGFIIAGAMKDLPLDGDACSLLGINISDGNKNTNKGFNNVPLNSNEQYNNPGTVNKDCEQNNTGDYCFTNNTKFRLEIKLTGKRNPSDVGFETQRVTIEQGQTECINNLTAVNWRVDYSEILNYAPTNSNYYHGNKQVLVERCKSKTYFLK